MKVTWKSLEEGKYMTNIHDIKKDVPGFMWILIWAVTDDVKWDQ